MGLKTLGGWVGGGEVTKWETKERKQTSNKGSSRCRGRTRWEWGREESFKTHMGDRTVHSDPHHPSAAKMILGPGGEKLLRRKKKKALKKPGKLMNSRCLKKTQIVDAQRKRSG